MVYSLLAGAISTMIECLADETRDGFAARVAKIASPRCQDDEIAGGDPSHAPARRAYEKVGFSVHLPSIYMYRKL